MWKSWSKMPSTTVRRRGSTLGESCVRNSTAPTSRSIWAPVWCFDMERIPKLDTTQNMPYSRIICLVLSVDADIHLHFFPFMIWLVMNRSTVVRPIKTSLPVIENISINAAWQYKDTHFTYFLCSIITLDSVPINSRTSSCNGTSGQLNHSRRKTNSILSWTRSGTAMRPWSSLLLIFLRARTLISTKECPYGEKLWCMNTV